MHILYLHQYFRTPAQGGALRSYYIGRALVEAGHRVTMITAHNQPQYQVQEVEGITVHYLPVPYANQMGAAARTGAFMRFLWQSLRIALKQEQVDVVYATSTPLTVGITALLLKLLRHKPYVFEVRDLWPEAPVQLGYIRSPLLKWALYRLEKLIYRHAQHIITLSPGMEQGVRQVAPGKPISMLPNMSDCRFYLPAPKPATYRGFPVQRQLVISYTGALGRANRLQFLLDLAAACANAGLHQVLFLVAGAGAEAGILQQQARERQLTQVHFLGELNREEVRELLQASDATYTSFDLHPVLQTNSPNKFFDALAAGKLCLVNTQGWLRQLVEQHRCGLYCDPLDPASTVPHLQLLLNEPELLREFQHNARVLAEREFERERISGEVVRIMNYGL